MSVADTHVFPPAGAEDAFESRFSLIRRGYDPLEVDHHIDRMESRLRELQGELVRVCAERDAARQGLVEAREEAYRQISAELADLLHAAEVHADRVRKESEQRAEAEMGEAADRAEKVQRDAECEAERLRKLGDEAIHHAKDEATRVMGTLGARRTAVHGELRDARDGLMRALEHLEATMAIAEGTLVVAESPSLPAALQPVPAASQDDLLGSVEGFDLVLPPADRPQPSKDEQA